MGRIDKPWGYEEQVLITQVEVGDRTGMLGMRKLVINTDEMTSYAIHEDQSDIIYLQSGQVTLKVEGKLEELEESNAKVVRSGQKHQLHNIGSDVAELLEISFPYRPEDIERLSDPYSTERPENLEE